MNLRKESLLRALPSALVFLKREVPAGRKAASIIGSVVSASAQGGSAFAVDLAAFVEKNDESKGTVDSAAEIFASVRSATALTSTTAKGTGATRDSAPAARSVEHAEVECFAKGPSKEALLAKVHQSERAAYRRLLTARDKLSDPMVWGDALSVTTPHPNHTLTSQPIPNHPAQDKHEHTTSPINQLPPTTPHPTTHPSHRVSR